MNSHSPMVSICVLTYNQEGTIAQTLNSLLNQICDFDFEILIGEDCSSDRTLEICREFQALYPKKLRVIAAPSNLGVTRNFCAVTKWVSGKYMAFCGGDDFWHNPSKLALQVGFMEAHRDYGLVHSRCNFLCDATGEVKEFERNDHHSGKVFEEILIGTYGIITVTALLRTSDFRKYVELEENIKKGYLMEDHPMWLDISYHSLVGYIPVSLATYRVNAESVSHSTNPAKDLAFMSSRWAVERDYSNKYDVSPRVTHALKATKNKVCVHRAFASRTLRVALLWLGNMNILYLLRHPDPFLLGLGVLSLLGINKPRIEAIKSVACRS